MVFKFAHHLLFRVGWAHTGFGTNTSAWQGTAAAQFAVDFHAFETAVPGSATQLALASDMQLQLARDIPSIPFLSTGYWYLFNTKQWVGWATTANEYQQVCAAFEYQFETVKVREILALHPMVINAPQITGPSTMSVNHESANNFLNLTITDTCTCFPTFTAYANGTVWGTQINLGRTGKISRWTSILFKAGITTLLSLLKTASGRKHPTK